MGTNDLPGNIARNDQVAKRLIAVMGPRLAMTDPNPSGALPAA